MGGWALSLFLVCWGALRGFVLSLLHAGIDDLPTPTFPHPPLPTPPYLTRLPVCAAAAGRRH